MLIYNSAYSTEESTYSNWVNVAITDKMSYFCFDMLIFILFYCSVTGVLFFLNLLWNSNCLYLWEHINSLCQIRLFVVHVNRQWNVNMFYRYRENKQMEDRRCWHYLHKVAHGVANT